MKSVVSEKGQVTIPKPPRDSLALSPGTELELEEAHGTLVARRVAKTDPISGLVGLLGRMDVDAALTDLRGPGWRAALDQRGRGHRRR